MHASMYSMQVDTHVQTHSLAHTHTLTTTHIWMHAHIAHTASPFILFICHSTEPIPVYYVLMFCSILTHEHMTEIDPNS